VSRTKQVEQLRNIRIINSTTRSHLVGNFHTIFIMVDGSMNIKFADCRDYGHGNSGKKDRILCYTGTMTGLSRMVLITNF
jgi:hypothetical protein